jgi:hypothetical protein
MDGHSFAHSFSQCGMKAMLKQIPREYCLWMNLTFEEHWSLFLVLLTDLIVFTFL